MYHLPLAHLHLSPDFRTTRPERWHTFPWLKDTKIVVSSSSFFIKLKLTFGAILYLLDFILMEAVHRSDGYRLEHLSKFLVKTFPVGRHYSLSRVFAAKVQKHV